MKKIIFLAAIFICNFIFGQAPEAFKYQAVVRDTAGNVIANQTVYLRMRILQGTAQGTPVYSELFSDVTNDYGLLNVEIGKGTPELNSFAAIDWSKGPYFIETSMDADGGGITYNVMGTSQMMSVPYALYAKSAGNGLPTGTNNGDMLYWKDGQWEKLAKGNEGQFLTVKNGLPTWETVTPSKPQKHYIGEQFGGGIVFWISEDSLHGLIAETFDQTLNDGMCTFYKAQMNINKQIYHSIEGSKYFDWRIPSLGELQKMYMYQIYLTGISKTNPYYWSSTTYNATGGIYTFSLDNNTLWNSSASDIANLRAVRNF